MVTSLYHVHCKLVSGGATHLSAERDEVSYRASSILYQCHSHPCHSHPSTSSTHSMSSSLQSWESTARSLLGLVEVCALHKNTSSNQHLLNRLDGPRGKSAQGPGEFGPQWPSDYMPSRRDRETQSIKQKTYSQKSPVSLNQIRQLEQQTTSSRCVHLPPGGATFECCLGSAYCLVDISL